MKGFASAHAVLVTRQTTSRISKVLFIRSESNVPIKKKAPSDPNSNSVVTFAVIDVINQQLAALHVI
jgi:hypothetical protein